MTDIEGAAVEAIQAKVVIVDRHGGLVYGGDVITYYLGMIGISCPAARIGGPVKVTTRHEQ